MPFSKGIIAKLLLEKIQGQKILKKILKKIYTVWIEAKICVPE